MDPYFYAKLTGDRSDITQGRGLPTCPPPTKNGGGYASGSPTPDPSTLSNAPSCVVDPAYTVIGPWMTADAAKRFFRDYGCGTSMDDKCVGKDAKR